MKEVYGLYCQYNKPTRDSPSWIAITSKRSLSAQEILEQPEGFRVTRLENPTARQRQSYLKRQRGKKTRKPKIKRKPKEKVSNEDGKSGFGAGS